MRRSFVILASAIIAVASPYAIAAASKSTTDAPPPVPGGIWKAVVPPEKMHGEFDNRDPMGLIAGADIPADCSLNWTNPDDGKLYCFVSGTSLVYFLQSPNSYLRDARAAWLQRHSPVH